MHGRFKIAKVTHMTSPQDQAGAVPAETPLATSSSQIGGPNAINPPEAAGNAALGTCVKCKERAAELVIRRNINTCFPCLDAQMVLRVRGGLRSGGAVTRGDRVALAFSGGPASAMLLHYMQGQRNEQAGEWDREQMAYSLVVLHVAEDPGRGPFAAADLSLPLDSGVEFKRIPLEDAFLQEEGDPVARRQRLEALLAAAHDATGREDLIAHLRLNLLLGACRELEYSKLVWAHCAAALAARAVAASVKGGGYALPADVRHLDARHVENGGPMMVYPVREVFQEEVNAVAGRLGVPIEPPLLEADKQSLNALAAAFLTNVAAHNPGVVSNINSTVSRLASFAWNEPPPTTKPLRIGEVLATQGEEEKAEEEALCPLCWAPMADDEVLEAATRAPSPLAAACHSCLHGIFETGDAFSLLPGQLQQRMGRAAEAWATAREEGDASDAEELRRNACRKGVNFW